ncbi:MAG: 50S ribosomal protein L23 [Candidatus Pacebacteria bacterium]|nr:50S ribosomal protein L23 [Candidatus Paceibacterota bacterium]
MALFRIKKDGEENAAEAVAPAVEKKTPKAEKKVDTKATPVITRDTASILTRPRITEKATLNAEEGVYVFDVSPRATKHDIIEAIQTLYKVTPRKINITRVPSKRVRVRGSRNLFGTKSGGKKAYVYLKKGDTISIA